MGIRGEVNGNGVVSRRELRKRRREDFYHETHETHESRRGGRERFVRRREEIFNHGLRGWARMGEVHVMQPPAVAEPAEALLFELLFGDQGWGGFGFSCGGRFWTNWSKSDS